MRIREPRTTALVFSSGKMVCTGAKRYLMIAIDFSKFVMFSFISVKNSPDLLLESMLGLSKNLDHLLVDPIVCVYVDFNVFI